MGPSAHRQARVCFEPPSRHNLFACHGCESTLHCISRRTRISQSHKSLNSSIPCCIPRVPDHASTRADYVCIDTLVHGRRQLGTDAWQNGAGSAARLPDSSHRLPLSWPSLFAWRSWTPLLRRCPGEVRMPFLRLISINSHNILGSSIFAAKIFAACETSHGNLSLAGHGGRGLNGLFSWTMSGT